MESVLHRGGVRKNAIFPLRFSSRFFFANPIVSFFWTVAAVLRFPKRRRESPSALTRGFRQKHWFQSAPSGSCKLRYRPRSLHCPSSNWIVVNFTLGLTRRVFSSHLILQDYRTGQHELKKQRQPSSKRWLNQVNYITSCPRQLPFRLVTYIKELMVKEVLIFAKKINFFYEGEKMWGNIKFWDSRFI